MSAPFLLGKSRAETVTERQGGHIVIMAREFQKGDRNMEKTMTLDALPIGSQGQIVEINVTDEKKRRRMFDLGVTKGTGIFAIMKSPFGDPVAYQIRDTLIAIRHDDARKIDIALI